MTSVNPWPRLGDWSTFEELARLQARALEPSLSMARGSPFYARRLTSGLRFEDVPFTTKEDLRAGYPYEFLARPTSEVATYHESSGTTGQPIASFLTEADWAECSDRFTRGAANLGPEDRVLVKTPYSMATTAHQMHNAARSRGAMVVPADNRSSMMTYQRVLQLLRDVGVTVTWCLPSEPLFWAAAAWAAGMEPAELGRGLRAMVVAGELLSPAKRDRISQLWGGVRVVEDYGSTETTSLAGECGAGTLHAWADRFLLEIFDPATGAITPRGRGQLVVTSLYRQAMPLVRYNLEDFVDLWDEPCSCGWVLPRIRVRGRPIPVAQGTQAAQGLHQSAIDEIVYRLPMEYRALFWRGLVKGDRLQLEIEAVPARAAECQERLERELPAALGVASEVVVVPPGALVPHQVLLRQTPFTKPRFLFSSEQDWDRGLIYQE
jgi:phenylacetate-CoA ligase